MCLTTTQERWRLLPSIVLILAAFGVSSANAQIEETRRAFDDSFTHSGAPNANFSHRKSMRVADRSSGERTSFIAFDLLNLTGNVTSATMRLFVDDVRRDGTVRVSTIIGNWFELGLRFSNQPFINPPVTSFDINDIDEGGYVEVDVTSIIRSFQARMPPPFGIALQSAGDVDVNFATDESSNPPQLVLITDGGPINTAPAVAIVAPADGSSFVEGDSILFTGTAMDAQEGNLAGSLSWTSDIDGLLATANSFSTTLSAGTHTITASVTDSGGLTGTSTITVSVNPAGGGSTQTLTPQDDAFTHAGAPRANFGSRNSMRTANRASGERTSFVDFNWSLVTGTVTSAKLRLYVDRVRRVGTLQTSAVLGNWFESGIRFENQPGISASTTSISFTGAVEGSFIEIDVTTIVQGFQARMPSPNGFALVSAGDLDASFATVESANPPELVLTTTAP